MLKTELYIREPERVYISLGRNRWYKIYKIHYDSYQVTVEEEPNIFLTVSIDNVMWDFCNMNNTEKQAFLGRFTKSTW